MNYQFWIHEQSKLHIFINEYTLFNIPVFTSVVLGSNPAHDDFVNYLLAPPDIIFTIKRDQKQQI